MQSPTEHIGHMIQLGFTISVRVEEPIIKYPEAVLNRVKVDTIDQADALNDAMLIAAILPTYAVDSRGVGLLQHHIIEEQVAFQAAGKQGFDLLPKQTGRQFLLLEIAVHIVVRQVSKVVGQISTGVVDLARQQVLAVKFASRFHLATRTKLCLRKSYYIQPHRYRQLFLGQITEQTVA